MRIIHARKTRTSSLPYRIYAHEWDHRSRCIITPEDTPPNRARYLEKVSKHIISDTMTIEDIVARLEENGRYTVDDVITAFRFREDNGNLLNYARQLSGQLERGGKTRTARAYLTVCKGLVDYNKGADIPLRHINLRLISDFENHMKECGKAPNTISYYMRNLRSIYNKAIADKRITPQAENPFANVFTGFAKTVKRALVSADMASLHEVDFKAFFDQFTADSPEFRKYKNLHKAWRYFFFCFHARGLCFVDLAYMRKGNIRNGILTYYRKKTGKLIEVTVTPQMQEIIDSFADEVRDSDYLFPIITTDRKSARLQYESALSVQNRRLKELCRLAGIKKGLTTHVARHTWASMGKFNNIPLAVISEGLGHSDQKTTYTYLASLDRSMLDYANELISNSIFGPQPESPPPIPAFAGGASNEFMLKSLAYKQEAESR